MRHILIAIPLVLVAAGGFTACATKKFVRSNVGEVNEKVESQSKSIEQTQERTRQNESRIGEVDRKAQSAQQSAQQASRTADEASGVAKQVAKDVEARTDAMDKASRRLVYEIVISEDEGNFSFGSADLPAAAKKQLDELVARLKQDSKDVFIEIEGYTDSIGSSAVNQKIGLQRAEAVERYLYEQYQIPLHKMDVISYGEERPIAPNRTRAGRAKNRRVEIKVLA